MALVPVCATAQTRGETRQFGKLAGNPTMKAVEKFLKKYPESVYAPKVLNIKDFTLRILSTDGTREAERIIPVYSMEDVPAPATITIPMEIITPLGNRYYLHFAYLNGASSSEINCRRGRMLS